MNFQWFSIWASSFYDEVSRLFCVLTDKLSEDNIGWKWKRRREITEKHLTKTHTVHFPQENNYSGNGEKSVCVTVKLLLFNCRRNCHAIRLQWSMTLHFTEVINFLFIWRKKKRSFVCRCERKEIVLFVFVRVKSTWSNWSGNTFRQPLNECDFCSITLYHSDNLALYVSVRLNFKLKSMQTRRSPELNFKQTKHDTNLEHRSRDKRQTTGRSFCHVTSELRASNTFKVSNKSRAANEKCDPNVWAANKAFDSD